MKTTLFQTVLQKFLPRLEDVPLDFYEMRRRQGTVSAFWGVVVLFSLLAAIVHSSLGQLLVALLSLGLCGIGIVTLYVIIRMRNILIAQCLAGILFLPTAWYFIATGGVNGMGPLWVLLYPVMFIIGLGLRFGMTYSLLLFVGVVIFGFVSSDIDGWLHYDDVNKYQYLVILSCVTVFSLWSELSRARTQEDLVDLARRMEISALQDMLTGLGNRRDFYGRYDQELARVARKDSPMSLCMCDIDFFREFNEKNGSECGDVALKYVATTLQNALRKQDVIFRWGGEEFLILLPEMNIEGARIVAERLRRIIESQPLVYEGRIFSLTLSFGVQECDFVMSVDQNVLAADRKLCQAKNLGRNCVSG